MSRRRPKGALVLFTDVNSLFICEQYFHAIAQSIPALISDVDGFVYCVRDDLPINSFCNSYGKTFPIYRLDDLERVIDEQQIGKCYVMMNNEPMAFVNAIINRIVSTGKCSVEMVPSRIRARYHRVRTGKPVFTVTSLARGIGKSHIVRFFCNIARRADSVTSYRAKVAVIIPISSVEVQQKDGRVSFDEPFFVEYDATTNDFSGLHDQEVVQHICAYLQAGAHRVFATSDVQLGLIHAEQAADIVIYYSRDCTAPYIESVARFCVVETVSLANVAKQALWPGLVNVHECTDIIAISMGNQMSRDESDKVRNVFRNKPNGKDAFCTVHFAVARCDGMQHTASNFKFSSADINAAANDAAVDFAAVRMLPCILSPQGIEGATQILAPYEEPAMVERDKLSVVVVKLPLDTEEINRGDDRLMMSQIVDCEDSLSNWMAQYFVMNRRPPLKEHFQHQASIIEAMARASESELFIRNNDAENRESFCRLFLSAHLPPGFRVTSGEIVDCIGHPTGQLDVVIVNSACPTMSLEEDMFSPMLADNVLSVLEVKTTLSKDSMAKALRQLRPIKALMPTHCTLTQPCGRIVKDPLGGKILTGIFSFKITEDIEGHVEQLLREYPNVADFVIVSNTFGFFSMDLLDVCGFKVDCNTRLCGDVKSYVKTTCRGQELAILYGVLNSMAATRRFSGSNCLRYLTGTWVEPIRRDPSSRPR